MLDQQLLEFARSMRQAPTHPELFLWKVLRGRRFSGYKFRRQYIIHPFILDFYCADLSLAVELDGYHHARQKEREHDQARTIFLNQHHVTVLRYWNRDVIENPEHVLQHLWDEMKKLAALNDN